MLLPSPQVGWPRIEPLWAVAAATIDSTRGDSRRQAMSRRNGTARVGRPSTGPGMVQDMGTGAGGEAEPAGAPAQRARWRARWAAVAAVVAALVWLAVDLFGPRSTSLRSFDPIEVARLESAMWRSYYDNDRLHLFNQLAELMRM